jgi:hypothetical protein
MGRTTLSSESSISSPDTEETFGLSRSQIALAMTQTEQQMFRQASLPTPLSSTEPIPSASELARRVREDKLGPLQRNTPLSPSDPMYRAACFNCHRLGHVRVNCQWYECPHCQTFRPGHAQRDCPRVCPATPTPFRASTSAGTTLVNGDLSDYDDPTDDVGYSNQTGSPVGEARF